MSLGPGPTFDTLGEVDGKQVVDIEGTDVHPTTGHLNMTTVSQRDDLTLGQALTLWMSGREQLVPRDLVYPPDKSKDEIDQENNTDFKHSEDNAEYAALCYLKYPSAVTVETVTDPGPSVGKLQPGDAIDVRQRQAGGQPRPVHRAAEDHQTRRQAIVLDYRRKNAPAGVATVTLGSNADRDYGYLGVAVLDAPWAPFSIDFNLANIGGPSAGLMFSLAVVDKLTTGDLNDGKFVAGTGTIDERRQGRLHRRHHPQDVGRPAKPAPRVFLVPADNCDEAKTAHDDGLQLIKVDTLGQAVDALHAFPPVANLPVAERLPYEPNA